MALVRGEGQSGRWVSWFPGWRPPVDRLVAAVPDPATDLITGAFSVQTTAWWRCCRHGALDRLFGRLSPHSSFISDQLTAKTGTGASQQRNQPKSPLGGADFGDLRAKKGKRRKWRHQRHLKFLSPKKKTTNFAFLCLDSSISPWKPKEAAMLRCRRWWIGKRGAPNSRKGEGWPFFGGEPVSIQQYWLHWEANRPVTEAALPDGRTRKQPSGALIDRHR